MAQETKLPEDEFKLPTLASESSDSGAASESLNKDLEREVDMAMALEHGPGQMSAPPSPISVGGGFPTTPSSAVQPEAPLAGSLGVMPQTADDGDLIEKEWVEKAKQIVERTKNDPYVQSREINLVKTDYLKKRYNKDIGVSS